MLKSRRWWLGAVVAIVVGQATTRESSAALDLSLVVDASGSISGPEFTLQLEGYARAFEDPVIQAQIASVGGINANFILFATTAKVGVGFTSITNAMQAQAFANAIRLTDRSGIGGTTSIAAGLQLANSQLTALGANRSPDAIVDVSGDGIQNVGTGNQNQLNQLVRDQRDALLANGVDRINGLVIQDMSLVNYYQTNVAGGTGNFVNFVSTFAQFDTAVRAKIQQELAPVPEPSTLAMGCGGMLVLAWRGYRRRMGQVAA